MKRATGNGRTNARLTNARFAILAAACAAGCLGPVASAQVRIAQWNVTNYADGNSARDAAFKTAIYGAFMGRSMSPDLIVVQEMIESSGSGQANVHAFRDMLNEAPGSPGDWMSVPYVVDNGDTGNALFYRSSKFAHVDTLALTDGTGPSGPPRDNHRFRMRLAGYTGAGAEIYLYSSHMKAQEGGSDDDNRRLLEAQRVRTNTGTLPAGAHYMLCGDFNIQTSSEGAYQELLGAGSGQLVDPINSPGNWQSSGFRFVHTQDPFGAGGMDDRHDQILISPSLRDGEGWEYLANTPGGNRMLAYSTTSWDDANHSYRAWGNDGTSYNIALRTTGNTMVGAEIAQALIDSTGGATGHLPVFLDLQVPAKLEAPASVSFGTVGQGTSASVMVTISNAGDVGLFSRDGTGRGIDALNYTLGVSSGFGLPGGAGPFADGAGGGENVHTITMDTTTTGVKSGTLTITSDDGNGAVRVVNISGEVTVGGIAPPPAGDYDVNNDGLVDNEDLYSWFSLLTDVNLDSVVNSADLDFLRAGLRWYESVNSAPGR